MENKEKETVQENVQETTSSTSENKVSKGNKKILTILIPVIAVVVIIAGLLAFYFGYFTKPEQIFKQMISRGIDSIFTENTYYSSVKSNIDLDLNLITNSDFVSKDILDLINNIDLSIGAQIDKKDKQMVVSLDSDYNKKALLDAKLFVNQNEKSTYIYAKDLLDKYIKIDLEDESYASISEVFTNLSAEDKKAGQAIIKVIKDEFKSVIKPEYVFKHKVETIIEGKKTNATNYVLKMSVKQFAVEFKTMLINLKNNQEFLNALGDNKEELLSQIESIIEECANLENAENASNSMIQLNVYTTGIVPNVGKADVLMYDNETTMSISFTKTSENEISFETIANEQTVLNGTLKTQDETENKGNVEILLNIPQMASLTVKIGYNNEYDVAIDKIDASKVVTMEGITTEEQTKLMTNLQNSELYKLIEKYSAMFIGQNDSFESEGSIGEITTGDGVTINEDETKDNNEVKNNNLETTQIMDYDKEVKMNIPTPIGFNAEKFSDTYLTLTKGNVTINVSSGYGSEEDYIKSRKSFHEEYKDAKTSDVKTITVGGRTYKYIDLQYTSNSYTYYKKYICSKISDKYVVTFEIIDANKINDTELNELLNITINK